MKMTELNENALEGVTGGYIREGVDENGKRVWHVISIATGEIAGTFDNTISAVIFDNEINAQFK